MHSYSTHVNISYCKYAPCDMLDVLLVPLDQLRIREHENTGGHEVMTGD